MKRIEVVKEDTQTTKDKGDLLEKFTASFLKSQNYRVESQIRVAASELDLLCENIINGKNICRV